jgi:mortality factor 4-like protein 1
MKINDETRALRQKLQEEVKPRKAKKVAQKGKKRKRADEKPEALFHLEIPRPLRKKLLKDKTMIEEKALVPLPRDPCVGAILDNYTRLLHPHAAGSGVFDEVVEGIRAYFDAVAYTRLLYLAEKAQASEMLKKNKNVSPSLIYGPEHLLRLFVKFPEFLGTLEMEDDAKIILREKLENFLQYLVDNKKTLFLREYQTAANK